MKTIPIRAESSDQLVMVGCSILHKEVDSLIKKNKWHLQTHYLDSALHSYVNKLSKALNEALDEEEAKGKNTVVFYGSCHPGMDSFIETHQSCRTRGQNCIVMLLGYEYFMRELSQGAFFLLEDWALSWEKELIKSFGNNTGVIRDIFHSSHKYILAIRTPYSSDYTATAEKAAAFVDLPLRWIDVNLQELERVMTEAIKNKLDKLHD